ncbi:potassium voltage-gated channel protein Shaw-like isoform X2 [Biomphalaria glabrata]|uniref:Potassium voltage-gated channel protein Shaw-like isoform X2 n=2 Tax=Biomphalaria glabrata TaxID=6526 RepID=A0A9W2YJ28_BIOGL|nr:potassium voltage-gated channel protein Shaw-like isoform X2 [Biomphalaria glabrata]
MSKLDLLMNNGQVLINVGGEVFVTTRSTLLSLPNTLLADVIDPRVPLHTALQDNQVQFQVDADVSFLPDYNQHGRSGTRPRGRKSVDRSKYVFVGQPSPHDPSSGHLSSECFHSSQLNSASLEGNVGSAQRPHSLHTPWRPAAPSPLNTYSTSWPYGHISKRPASFQLKSSHDNMVSFGQTSSKNYIQTIFIDRNPILVPYILDAYRLGELHLPSNVCSLSIRAELEFWKIPEDLMSECCWKNFHEGLKTMKIVNSISKSLYGRYDEDVSEVKKLSLMGKIWLVMETPSYNWVAKFREVKPEFQSIVENRTSGNITISVIDMNVFYTNIYVLAAIEHFLRAFFTLEFLIRLVTCPEKKEFLRNIHNIMDVVIILLMWIRWTLDYIITQHADHYSSDQSYLLMVFNSLMGVRVLSVFHLTKYSTALKVMYLSIYTVMKELLMLVMILAAAVLIFGTSMYVAENISSTDDDNPVFENIPLAMWWAVVTMTTLGYGDFVPKHLAGYLVGAMCAITGLLLFAMPIAIVAANFANYYDNITSTAQGRRRKLLVERFSHLWRRRQKSGPKSSTLKSPDYVGTKVKGPRLQVPGDSIHPTCNTISGTLDVFPTTDARTEQSFLPKQKMETFSSTGVEVPSNVPARNNT